MRLRPSKSLLALAAVLLFTAAPSFAQTRREAESPWNAHQRQLARDAARLARDARGIVPLVELFRDYPWADPEVTRGELERLYADRRIPADRRAYVGALLARVRLRAGDVEGANALTTELGYLTDFRVIGSFDDEGKRGFAAELPPERDRNARWDSATTYRGKERAVTWRRYPSETTHFGYVSFDAVFRPYENVCGFAETFVNVPRAQPVTLFVGNGGAGKVWWNGEEVLSDDIYRQPDPDRHVAQVVARQGHNRLLVKMCVQDTTWGFFVRVGDAAGAPIPGVTADASEHRDVAATAPAVRAPTRPLRTPLAALEEAARGDAPRPEALENLARFLAYTGADDPAERRARQLSARAAEAQPTVPRLVLAAALANERGDVQRFADDAVRRFPNDREAQLLHARMRAGGPSPEDMLPVLERLARGTDRFAIEAALLRATILSGLELNDAALAVASEAAARAPKAPGLIEQHAAFASSAGRANLEIELRRAAVAARYDDLDSRRVLALDALHRNDRAAATGELEILAALVPDQPQNQLFLSQIYEGLGLDDEAIAALTQAEALAPEDATLIAARGRLLLRLHQDGAARDALRQALALRPQDAETRELLEQIEPETRQDEAYAVASEELLRRRSERSGFPVTVLEDLTVNTVFENGLGSSFHQYAAQAHDEEGARELRTYSIQFDPDAQRVDIREARVYRRDGSVLEATQTFEQPLGEPWYRIYYDTRALVVVFPTLEPGDTVELRYRLDDVAHRNVFADYYGDLEFLQGFSPVERVDYVLITPASRQLYFNQPRMRGLRHEQEVQGNQRIDRFFATDVRPIRSEQGMPGMTEIAPYLHVSTYRTWEEVGRWWWGLIQDQLVADEDLKQTVRDLVRGAPDLETKVRRIHDWVIAHTRYVGLEFGIHGYKPYRVPLIVQRGFGDCKDKASLLYTMFREAGIDARIVLVRTRRNGAIGSSPASLAVFDHAIAYVKDLDLYIDGTAEHSGMRELPEMDQGVSVLVVGPEDARLTTTPVLPPSESRRDRQLVAHLDADGSAQIDVEETITGGDAPSYRSRYEADGTRGDWFEQQLRTMFPGAVLESQRMEGLSELGAPVEVRYRANVPQLGRRDADGLVVAPTVLEDLLRSMARIPSRRYPLDLGGTRAYREERRIELPRGYRVASTPDGGDADSPFGRLHLTVEANGREVTAHTEFEIRKDRIAPDEYPAFRQWVERADAILRQQIHLTSEAGQ